MKICVIGGAGYIGSHIVKELINNNNEVVVIDNLSTGFKKLVNKDAKLYVGDITQKNELHNIFEKECKKNPFDAVIHLAAKLNVSESVLKPLEYYYNNVEGVRIVLELMIEFNIRNIIFSSTAMVYETTETNLFEESDPVNPTNPYGATKLASEELIKFVCNSNAINYCIFRCANIAGADESLEIGSMKSNVTALIPVTVEAALGIRDKVIIFGDDFPTRDGTCCIDYIHVSDLAKAYIYGIEYIIKQDKSILVNLGSGKGYTVKEVIDEMCKIKPIKYEIGQRRKGDLANIIVSNQLAKNLLGWEPKYDLRSMILSEMRFKEKLIK